MEDIRLEEKTVDNILEQQRISDRAWILAESPIMAPEETLVRVED